MVSTQVTFKGATVDSKGAKVDRSSHPCSGVDIFELLLIVVVDDVRNTTGTTGGLVSAATSANTEVQSILVGL